jgi:hypothetical protein
LVVVLVVVKTQLLQLVVLEVVVVEVLINPPSSLPPLVHLVKVTLVQLVFKTTEAEAVVVPALLEAF